MSIMPNSRAFMTQALRADNPPRETFHKFFERWLCEQQSYLEELVSAAKNHNENPNKHGDDAILVPLIGRVLGHYEQYYQAKSRWETLDANSMFAPTWLSKLEDAFLWIGGWRPTLAIHLLYSKSGIQFEAKIEDLIRGIATTNDLGELGINQIRRIDELQSKTIYQERVLSEKLAKQQESLADTLMVELSHAVSEMTRNKNGGLEDRENEEKVGLALDCKECGMEELLHMADELRLETLKAVVEILKPLQVVYFLIAAAELQLRIHEWGKKRELDPNGKLMG